MIDEFVNGYIEAALWADCQPAAPTHEELVQHALMEGATREYVADADLDRLTADYGESYRDTAECGDGQHLTMTDEGRAIMAAPCERFCRENAADLALYCEAIPYDPSKGSPMSYAGHDFWLTRGGHGVGFWDRGLDALGDRLTAAAEAFGEAFAPWDCGDGTADVDA